MPTYEYACRDCGEHLEVVQSFKDDALTTCPGCQGTLRKVFSAAGLIFKGSGWHAKDYATSTRGKASATASSGGDATSSGDGAASTESSGDTSPGGSSETSKGSSDSSVSASTTASSDAGSSPQKRSA